MLEALIWADHTLLIMLRIEAAVQVIVALSALQLCVLLFLTVVQVRALRAK